MEDERNVVYHYCDMSAFLNIMKTKTLWLSDVKKSNDAEEGKYLLKKLLNYIEVERIGSSPEKQQQIEKAIHIVEEYMDMKDFRAYIPRGFNYEQFLEDMEQIDNATEEFNIINTEINFSEIWEEIEKEIGEDYDHVAGIEPGDEYITDKFNTPIYTTCFSGNRDLLSQWRGYAGDGSGVAIGFRTKYFQQWRIACGSKRPIPEIAAKFARVNYEDKETEDILYCKSKEIINIAGDITENDDKDLNKLAIRAIEEILDELRERAIFYKNKLFSEEDEYRILFNSMVKCVNSQYLIDNCAQDEIRNRIKDFSLSELKYRVGREGIISYYELSFEPVMNDIIAEIVLGPKCKMSTADIEFLLSSFGYNCIGNGVFDQRSIYIHHSRLSYR